MCVCREREGEGGGLNREGGILQNLTAKGGLVREGGLIELLR